MHIESARQLLKDLKKCAKFAGIEKKMFLGFGTMLGAVRDQALIPHDDDMDICFRSISSGERELFYSKCLNAGLMNGWPEPKKRLSCKPGGELLWFSVKREEKTTRCCVWFFFDWCNYTFHSKGKIWVSDLHFDAKLGWNQNDHGIALGAPSHHFEKFTDIDFEGGRYRIPASAGALCDEYYPGWIVPAEGGSSAQNKIIRIERWEDESTWKNLK